MRKFPILLPFILLAASSLCAVAATPSNRITCTGSDNQPTAGVFSFAFDTAVAVGNGGSGGGSGKAIYAMTVQIPLNASYDTIFKIATTGRHIPSCVVVKPNGSSVLTITMEDVLLSDVKLLSGDFFLNGFSSPRVQLSLAFASVTEQTTTQ